MAARRAVHQALGELEHHRDRGLVVGAEDRRVRVLPAAIDDHRLDRRGRRHGVQVRTQQDAVRAATPDAGQQVAGVGASGATGVVLVGLEPDPRQLAGDPVGARTLVTRRALDPAQGRERLVQPLALGLAGPPHRAGLGEMLNRGSAPTAAVTTSVAGSSAASGMRSAAGATPWAWPAPRRRTPGTAAPAAPDAT